MEPESVAEWPKLDPLTNRMVCHSCWNGTHYRELMVRKGINGKMERYYERRYKLTPKAEHACDGECDCVHRSEENWAAIEQQKAKQNRRELRQRLKEQLEDPQNPLLAINHDHKPKAKGKAHA